MSKQISIQELTASEFEPLLDQHVYCELQDMTIAFTLTQVKKYEYANQFRQPFSLFLTADGGETLKQGTYRLSFPALGTLELFVVPVSAGKHQISFN